MKVHFSRKVDETPMTYEGRPCKHCNNTLRYSANRSCVKCTKSRSKDNTHLSGGKYEGDPCKNCGNTQRYVKFKRCVHCASVSRRKRYAKTK